MKERDFIRRIIAASGLHEGVAAGPGDDLAVLQVGASRLVYGIDTITEGVDFPTLGTGGSAEAYSIGRKAALVNLSDIAAMGAEPFCMVVGATLGKGLPDEQVEGMYQGIVSVEAEYGMFLVGGDISTVDGPTSISVAVLGKLPGEPLLRSGAHPGELLLVTGTLGGSILGRHFDFTPRLREAGHLVKSGAASSCIDISDGLATDARHLAEASAVSIEITAHSIPVSIDARALSARDGTASIDHALYDGEDFELLFTTDASAAGALLKNWPFSTPVSVIGRAIAPSADSPPGSVFIVGEEGRKLLEDKGFQHET